MYLDIDAEIEKQIKVMFGFQSNMNKRGWVYLVRYGEQAIYKIGCTVGNPKERVSSLRLEHQ